MAFLQNDAQEYSNKVHQLENVYNHIAVLRRWCNNFTTSVAVEIQYYKILTTQGQCTRVVTANMLQQGYFKSNMDWESCHGWVACCKNVIGVEGNST